MVSHIQRGSVSAQIASRLELDVPPGDLPPFRIQLQHKLIRALLLPRPKLPAHLSRPLAYST